VDNQPKSLPSSVEALAHTHLTGDPLLHDHTAPQYERLLAALGTIDAVGRAYGLPLLKLIDQALDQIMAAMGLIEAGLYLSDDERRALVLVAARPRRGLIARQGAQLTLDQQACLPVQVAINHVATHLEIGDWRLMQSPISNLQLFAIPLLAGARLLGVLQVVWTGDDGWPAHDQVTLRWLAGKLAAAIEHARGYGQAHLERERTRALVDASNDAILLLDLQGRATMINRRAKYFFGLAERDVIGRSAEQLQAMFKLIFEDSAAFISWLAPLLTSTEERSVIELKVLRAEPRLLQCFSAPVLDPHERLHGRMLVFRDITREREVERMKNEFVSIVSHELRTPLTSIRGSLQLVLGRPQQPELGPRVRELLDISLKNSERLIRLINDILDISKIEQGSIQLRRVSLDPEDLCHTAVQEVAAFAGGRGIAIDIVGARELPPVSADRDRALQILTNLLSNAIKFSEAGQRVEVSASRHAGAICFAVRDCGRGIAPEDQQRIFEKFQQIDSSLTRDAGGTGLGLAICKALAEEHGGQIWVESTPQQGSTFAFTLPLALAGEPITASLEDPNRPVILVVDDDDDVRHAVRRILELGGYAIVEASRGAEALQLARLLQPALMTLDVMMPDLDGFDVIQVLRNSPLTRDLPVLFISATTEHDRGLELGGSGFLLKPFSPDELLDHVQQLVSPHRRVLVVDDDYHVRPTLTRLLQRGGFRVDEAADGRTALDQVQRLPPDLILLDIRMPDMDGYEVLRRLKQHPTHRHIPVVVLTASALGVDAMQRALDAGAVRYLEKPIASEELLAAIEEILA
jgi:PAS domain S-box-containing protein